VYSIYSTVFLKPLPFENSERIVAIWIRDQGGGVYGVAGGTLTAVRSLPAVDRAAVSVGTENALVGSGESEELRGALVSGEFFDVFRVRPAIGRLLHEGDARDESRPVVLSHRLWQRRFNGDPGVLGRSIRLGDRVHTVIGVLPSLVHYPEDAEYWMPYEIDAADGSQMGRGPFTAVARLKGSDLTQASAQAASIQLSGSDATASKVVLVPLIESIAGVYRSTLRILFVAVVMVLLIACFNVANLLLAQNVQRQRELAVRQAIGATRWTLVRQLVAESFALALLSGGVGLVLARLVGVVVVAAGGAEIPRITEITLDWRILVFTIVATLTSVCLCGAIPAWLASRRLASAHSIGRTIGQTRKARTSNILIGMQIAATLTLLVGSSLTLMSLYRLHKADLGFDTKNLTVTSVRPPASMLKENRNAHFYERILGRLRDQEGFEAVAAMSHVPLESALPPLATVSTEEGVVVRTGPNGPRMRVVSPDTFKALGAPIVKGREFLSTDLEGSTAAAIINQTLSIRLWPATDPIGKSLIVDSRGRKRTSRIVGVVGDFRQGPRRAPQPEVYLAAAQEPVRLMKVIVRSHLPYHVVAARVRAAVFSEDPTIPVSEMSTAVGLVQDGAAYTRFHAILLTVFGVFGVLLACSGILAVVMYAVSDRTREIGVRIAIGAAPRQVVSLLVRELTWPLVGGVVAGLFTVTQLGAVLQKQNVLFAVDPLDARIYLAVVIGLSILSIMAAWLPARRAALIEPTVALRAD
jgi:predicted permease